MTDDFVVHPFLAAVPDLDRLRDVVVDQLQLAAGCPESPWGLAGYGNVDQGTPHLRTLVVRRMLPGETLRLIWHTDVRSPKFSQEHHQCVARFWNAELRVQLLVRGRSESISTGPLVESEWAAADLPSRRMYLAEHPPGTVLDRPTINFPEQFSTQLPTIAESQAGRRNFGILITTVTEMDLLLLRREGNWRARFCYAENSEDNSPSGWRGQWVAP